MQLQKVHSLLLLIFGGVLCGLSFAPFDFIIGAFLGVVPMLWVEESIAQSGKWRKLRVFWSAYLFFAVFNFTGIWWVQYASWIGVIASVVVNSLFFALLMVLYSSIKSRMTTKAGYISFVVLWLGWEYVELIDWDLSWPWLTFGYSLANWTKLIQWISFTGALGGSLWILLLNLQAFFVLKAWKEKQDGFFIFRKALKFGYILLIPIVVSLVQYFTYDEKGKEADVVLLQPNMNPYSDRFIDENGKQDRPYASRVQVAMMLDRVDEKMDQNVDFLLMHETALPKTENNLEMKFSPDLAVLKNWREKYPNLNILTGIAYKEYRDYKGPIDELPPTYRRRRDGTFYEYFNSSILVNGSDSLAQYHKSRLVVGVERIPSYFVYLLRYLSDFNDDPNASVYNPNNGIQSEREVFYSQNDSMVVAPIICYESVFGEYVTEYVEKGANFLGIITNDAWWDDTPGYKQHWSFARMRAIETRRSVARSANTGWSGFINQRGDELMKSEYMKPDVMRGKIQLNNELTFYVKYGDIIGRWSLAIAIIFALNLIVKKIRGDKSVLI